MGYTTYFNGEVAVVPPLNEDEISFLNDFNQTRRMHRSGGPLFVKGEGPYGQGHGPDTIHDGNRPDPDQPGLWCQWVPSEDGTTIAWDEGEKFYEAAEWMNYIVTCLLAPTARKYVNLHIEEDPRLASFTCDHVINGEIHAEGEESDDRWKIKVTNNVIEVIEASIIYGDEKPEEPKWVAPTEEELREALTSLGASPPTISIKVWTLTVDANSPIVTMVLGTEAEVYDNLKMNYTNEDDPDFDVTTAEGIDALVTWLTEEQGVVLYIDEHTVEVPA